MREFINIVESSATLPDFEEAAGRLYLDLPNNGLPTVRSYVRMAVGHAPYGGKGPEDEDELIMAWCRDKVQEVYHSIFARLIQGGKIEAWREVTAGPDWEPSHWTHPGVYWCWNKGYAEAYWGDPHNHEGAGTHKFLIHAFLPVDHIDWTQTLMMNANPDYEEEYEVRVKDKAPVEIIGVENRGAFHA